MPPKKAVDSPLSFPLGLLQLVLKKRKQRPAPKPTTPNTLDLTPVVERLDRMNATLERSYAGSRRPVSS